MKSLAACIALSLSLPALASADPLPKDQPKVAALEWNHPRFSTAEYIVTGTLLAGLGVANLTLKDEAPRWRGGVLVDSQAMALGRADTAEGRHTAAQWSDYLLYTMMAWPYLDAGVATARGHADTGFQMALINTEAHVVNGLLTFLIKRTVRRERPHITEMCADRRDDPTCQNSGSFLSGHASTAFTGAGLVCAHHGALPLYGNKVADYGACATALAAAAVTGSLRVVANVHYASDVFAGAALGLASGWLLPKLLHYSSFTTGPASDTAKRHKTIAWSAAPMATPGGAMLMINGVTF